MLSSAESLSADATEPFILAAILSRRSCFVTLYFMHRTLKFGHLRRIAKTRKGRRVSPTGHVHGVFEARWNRGPTPVRPMLVRVMVVMVAATVLPLSPQQHQYR
jgi:hypothetical protein